MILFRVLLTNTGNLEEGEEFYLHAIQLTETKAMAADNLPKHIESRNHERTAREAQKCWMPATEED